MGHFRSCAAIVAVRKTSPPGAGGVPISPSSALVPASGVSPSVPWPILAPVVKDIDVRAAKLARAHFLAPTLIRKRSPISTGEGTSQTARLVRCGLVRNETGSELSR